MKLTGYNILFNLYSKISVDFINNEIVLNNFSYEKLNFIIYFYD